eukprot:7499064-Pyramimonas_sp.AAC.1
MVSEATDSISTPPAQDKENCLRENHGMGDETIVLEKQQVEENDVTTAIDTSMHSLVEDSNSPEQTPWMSCTVDPPI